MDVFWCRFSHPAWPYGVDEPRTMSGSEDDEMLERPSKETLGMDGQTKHNVNATEDDQSDARDEQTFKASRPPAQPQYILRGHSSQIHAVTFLRQNRCVLTGDADGWVVLWNLTTKRPVAVWRPHTSSILGLSEWTPNRIIT